MFNFDFKFRNPWFLHYWQIITGKVIFFLRNIIFFFWLIYHMFRNLYLKTMASHSFSTYYLVQTNFSESCVQNNPCFLGCLKNNICVQVVFKTIPVFRLCSKQSQGSGCVKNFPCVQVVFKTISVFRLCSKQSLCSGCVKNRLCVQVVFKRMRWLKRMRRMDSVSVPSSILLGNQSINQSQTN